MSNKLVHGHNNVLEEIARSIDITEGSHKTARERYQAVGKWLRRGASIIHPYAPSISTQGSFLLGTVVRPVGGADEYDIDLVCTLKADKSTFSMAQLKRAVGIELKQFARRLAGKPTPEDGRRCWTMEYADKVSFHMDILPALPKAITSRVKSRGARLAAARQYEKHAIAITDKTHSNFSQPCNNWPASNPVGYGMWFRHQQRDAVMARKRTVMEAERGYARIDQVPYDKVKTPLQRAIQLLKRHRDVMFNGDKDEPISMIITTLAACAYGGEKTTAEALRSILRNMNSRIEDRSRTAWVANPVQPRENFADKWAERPQKERMFRRWLRKARKDFLSYIDDSPSHRLPGNLRDALSRDTVEKALARVQQRHRQSSAKPRPTVPKPTISAAATKRRNPGKGAEKVSGRSNRGNASRPRQ